MNHTSISLRIVYPHEGTERLLESGKTEILIGRPKEGMPVDMDLSPDRSVSRQHARISLQNGEYWLEDLNSSGGTRLNGQEIKGKGKSRLQPGDKIVIGGATL